MPLTNPPALSGIPALLGQDEPAASSNTLLYTAPADTRVVVSSILVCNTGVTDDQIRVFFVPFGSSPSSANATIYDLTIPPGNPFAANVCPVLMPGDAVYVYSLNGTTTFTVSGSEVAS